MAIIPISCPYCLASAQVNSDDFSFKCSSCGKTVNTKDAIVNNYLRLFTDKATSAIASICSSANTRSTGSVIPRPIPSTRRVILSSAAAYWKSIKVGTMTSLSPEM